MEVGRRFSSFKEIEEFIKEFEESELITLYRRDSKTLQSRIKTCPLKTRNANPELKYYMLTYSCYKGGIKFKSKGQGKRKSSTFKEECPMKLTFSLSCDGQYLCLTKLYKDHNHEVNKNRYDLLPKKRRLNSSEKEEALKLKRLKCNKVLLKNYLHEKTGKNVLLKDITNIKVGESENNMTEVLEILEEEPNSFCEVLVDENNVLTGIYFQTSDMKKHYVNYPELLLLDATYKLNNLRMPLYILMVIDGNGEGAIVGSFILQNENSESIASMIKIFKKQNPSWESTSTIFTDKDFSERKTLQEEFPGTRLLLCLFHTLKSFRTNITTSAMGINSSQRDIVLDILQKLAYSRSPEEYSNHLDSLRNFNFPLVTKYFETNWHNCKEDWVNCYKKQCRTYGVTTTNHLESFNQKIKSVCSKFNTLQDFFRQFLILCNTLNLEKKQKSIKMYKKFVGFKSGSIEEKYYDLLTPFAFNLVKKNILKAEKVTFLEVRDSYAIVKSSTGSELKVNELVCSCPFFKDYVLPCKHIFKYRSANNMDSYYEILIPDRFKKKLYLKSYSQETPALEGEHYNFEKNEEVTLNISQTNKGQPLSTKNRKLTQHQKYSKAIIKCQQLATILSEMSMEKFNENFIQVENLCDMWNKHKTVKIVQIEENDNSDIHEGIILCSPSKSIGDICLPQQTASSVPEEFENIGHKPELNVREEDSVLESVDVQKSPTVSSIQKESLEMGLDLDASEPRTEHTQLISKKLETISFPTVSIDQGINTSEIIRNIKMPLKMIPRGRPKGFQTTVVGLKKKKKCPIKFINLEPIKRQKIVLSAIYPKNPDFVNEILHENKIVDTYELPNVHIINSSVLEDEVLIDEIEVFFTPDAFNKLILLFAEKKTCAKWFCKICNNLIRDNCVRCDSCLGWYHQSCTGLKRLPTLKKSWFCASCI